MAAAAMTTLSRRHGKAREEMGVPVGTALEILQGVLVRGREF